MLKKILLLFFLLPVFLSAAVPARITACSGARDAAVKIRIIPAPENQIAAFAAEEACRLLKRAGNDVAKAARPQKNAVNLIIGRNPAYPVTMEKMTHLPDGAFRIVKKGNDVFIFGIDTPTKNLHREHRPTGIGYSKGSLYGIYDFLERFAGVRFYFPGELGTIVPEKKLALPQKIDILDYPDMEERSHLPWPATSGKMYPGCNEYKRPAPHLLNTLRLRANSIMPNMSNALQHGGYLKRFYKTHPEYFALHPSGKRIPEIRDKYRTQICLNSGIEEEIYQDIKAYFLGKPASSRGMKKWDRYLFYPRGINMTHDDAFFWCACEKCRKIGLDSKAYKDPAVRKRISTEVWKFTGRIADRLKKENVPNARLLLLAYVPYDIVPDCEIPDNILPVVVVFPGIQGDTATLRRNDAVLKAWLKKCKGRIYLRSWTGKYMLRRFPGVPDFHHNILCDYFKERKEWFSGAFMAEGIDYYLFRHLNLYLFSKFTWNRETDLKAVLDEYFTLMYGKGAPFVREYFDALEKIWDKKLIKDMKDSMMGGEAVIASQREMWTEIFSDSCIRHFDSLWNKAERAAQKDKKALKRIKFMREQVYGPLLAEKQKYGLAQKAVDSWTVRPGETIWARPRRGDIAEVITTFKLTETDKALKIDFNCGEPEMKHIRAREKKSASGHIWTDADVEIFLNPSGDRKNFIQFCINVNGALDTIISGKGLQKNNIASVQVRRSEKGWEGTLTVPKTLLGQYKPVFPALLARRRLLEKGGPKIREEFYAWLPQPDPPNFHLPEYWGSIDLSGKADKNLLKDGDFTGLDIRDWKSRRFFLTKRDKANQKITFDTQCFVTGGQSVLLESTSGKEQVNIQLPVKGLKPNTRYRLSFFCKLDKVQGEGLDVCLYGKKAIHPMRRNRVSGTHPWHRLSFDLTVPENFPPNGVVIVANRMAKGRIWVDHVRLEEISPEEKEK